MALLMSVKEKETVSNAKMWEAWMNHAKEEGLDFAMHVHAKDFNQGLFQRHYVPEWIPTARCDMFDAEMMLMRKALKDPAITHLMMVSANSVPLKNLSFIYSEIERQPATRMCIDYDFRRFGGTRTHSPRAESWWLMSRSDAVVFVDTRILFGVPSSIKTGWIAATRTRLPWHYCFVRADGRRQFNWSTSAPCFPIGQARVKRGQSARNLVALIVRTCEMNHTLKHALGTPGPTSTSESKPGMNFWRLPFGLVASFSIMHFQKSLTRFL
jgi:hypothetical protein